MPLRKLCYYWDSTCFLAWLLPEIDRVPGCRQVLDAAEQGKVTIVTSAISLTEVIKLNKGPLRLTKDVEETIVAFFKQDYISVVQVTRSIAEQARSLIWRFPSLKPKDAIHAATAIYARKIHELPELHTHDDDFLQMNKKIGSPPIEIRTPELPQRTLDSLIASLPPVAPEEENAHDPGGVN